MISIVNDDSKLRAGDKNRIQGIAFYGRGHSLFCFQRSPRLYQCTSHSQLRFINDIHGGRT